MFPRPMAEPAAAARIPNWEPKNDEDRRLAEYATKVMELSKGIEDTVARYRDADSDDDD